MTQAICLICRTPTTWATREVLQDLDGAESFAVVECGACTALRTYPVPVDLAPYYAAEVGQMMVAQESGLHTWARRLLLERELRRFVPRVHPTGVLDVGSGAGDFAALMHKKGLEVVTVDAGRDTPPCTRDLPGAVHRRIDYDTGTIEGLSPAPGRIAVLRHVLEHVRDPATFLDRLAGYGAGHFYIVVPNAGCLERRLFGGAWFLWDPPRHLWHFTRATLDRLFQTLRFEVLASGHDTIPNIVPSLYRVLRLRGWPARVSDRFRPKGALAALSAPLNALLPGNVLWALVKAPAR